MSFIFTHYWAWLPLLAAYYVASAFLSQRMQGETGWKWFALNYAIGLFPWWGMVARHSRDIVGDGLVFDAVMSVSYLTAILWVTHAWRTLSAINLAGVGVMAAGLLMLKWK